MIGLPHSDVLAVTITLFISVMTIFALTLALFSYREAAKLKHYNFDLHRARLDATREYYEKAIGRSALQMTSNEESWRDANHLLMSALKKNNSQHSLDYNNFYADFGYSKDDVKVENDLIFVLTPFSGEEFDTFQNITSVCRNLGFRAVRGDEEYISGDILPHIVKLIARSRLIIANISTRNANVFYELGISHAMRKSTIIISKTMIDVPFDIQSNLIITFKDTEQLSSKLTQGLVRILAKNSG